MTEQRKDTWVRCPSVTRTGKFFYYSKESRRIILQSSLTDDWFLQENGKVSTEAFPTAAAAKEWAKTNVLH